MRASYYAVYSIHWWSGIVTKSTSVAVKLDSGQAIQEAACLGVMDRLTKGKNALYNPCTY